MTKKFALFFTFIYPNHTLSKFVKLGKYIIFNNEKTVF